MIAERVTTNSGSDARGRGSLREKGRVRDRAVWELCGFRKLKDVLTKITIFGPAADRYLTFFGLDFWTSFGVDFWTSFGLEFLIDF